MHGLVADQALVAHPDEPLALRTEQLGHQALVRAAALLNAGGVAFETRCEAVAPVVVEGAGALGRVLAHPVLFDELLKALQGGLGDPDAAVGLLPIPDVVVLQSENPDQGRQRETLEDQGSQDHAEGEEDDEVAPDEFRT